MTGATRTALALTDKAVNGHDPGANQAHWFLDGGVFITKAEIDSITDHTFSLFEVYTRWYSWIDFEPTEGNYDWSYIERDLAYTKERGVPYMPRIGVRSFSGSDDVMPSDLASQWQIDTLSGGVGRTAIVTSATPRLAFENMLKAMLDRWGDDPYFCGIQFPGETSGQDDCPGATYSFATAKQEWNNLFVNVTSHRADCYYALGWNFQNGLGGGASDSAIETTWDETFANLPTDGRVVLFTPDILLPGAGSSGGPGNFSSLDERVYPCFTNTYYNRPGINCEVLNHRRASSMQYQSHRHGPTWPLYKGDHNAEGGANDLNNDNILDMHEQFIWGRDRLELDLVIWSRINFPGNGSAVEFTFDRVHGDNTFGSTYGDDVGVVMQGWSASHNPNYRNG